MDSRREKKRIVIHGKANAKHYRKAIRECEIEASWNGDSLCFGFLDDDGKDGFYFEIADTETISLIKHVVDVAESVVSKR
jgi:hypothetical protein